MRRLRCNRVCGRPAHSLFQFFGFDPALRRPPSGTSRIAFVHLAPLDPVFSFYPKAPCPDTSPTPARDSEVNETDTSLDFAHDSGYIYDDEHLAFVSLNEEVCKMLGSMIRNPQPILL